MITYNTPVGSVSVRRGMNGSYLVVCVRDGIGACVARVAAHPQARERADKTARLHAERLVSEYKAALL